MGPGGERSPPPFLASAFVSLADRCSRGASSQVSKVLLGRLAALTEGVLSLPGGLDSDGYHRPEVCSPSWVMQSVPGVLQAGEGVSFLSGSLSLLLS